MADIKEINVYQTVSSVSFEVEPNTNIININKVTIEGDGGGGGGGATNLSTSQTASNFTINSDTGSDAVVPLGNGTLAGATSNDFTSAEKTKLSGIATGAEVNVNADWNAVSGDAQILNKPTISGINTGDDAVNSLYSGLEASKQNNITLTTIGTSGAATLVGATLNIPQYSGGGGGVPYTGATSDVNLGEFGIQLGNLEFDNTPTNIPTTAGSVYYNDSDGTLDLILKGGNVKLQIGQEVVIRVVNKTATNISLLESNYQAVRVTGAQGQRMKVDLAQATTDGLSAETIGLVTETIANNQEGFITTNGLVRNINTTGSLQSETWVDGDILYLSPTVAGRITNVKTVAPNHLVVIGYVIHAHATQGTIFVKVDNGYELDELHNVSINGGLANNDVLTYETATSLWKNKTIPAQSFASLTGKPTTVSGYGITDAVKTIINEFPNTSVTGTSSDTLLSTFTIPAGTLPASCMPDIRAKFSKVGDLSGAVIRLKINTVNNFATATQIGTYAAVLATDSFLVSRNPVISSGNMNIIIATTSVQSDLSGIATTESNFTIDVANDIYLFISVQLTTTSSDTVTLKAFKIIN